MGHDIYLLSEDGTELYYARYAVGNPTTRDANSVYSVFGAWEYDGGVSGTGEALVFTRDEIDKLVKKYLEGKTIPDTDDSRQFSDYCHGLRMLSAAHNWLQRHPSNKTVSIRFA